MTSPSNPTIGDCIACGRPLHDGDPDHLAHIGLGPEFICGPCWTWARKATRWFLVKTRRLPGQDTPARGLARVEHPALAVV